MANDTGRARRVLTIRSLFTLKLVGDGSVTPGKEKRRLIYRIKMMS